MTVQPTNGDRAAWALTALETFQGETGADDEDAVTDLLADLLHLCGMKPERWGEFFECLTRAVDHHLEELLEEGCSYE